MTDPRCLFLATETGPAVAFLLNGGEYVGKKTVNSDNDLHRSQPE